MGYSTLDLVSFWHDLTMISFLVSYYPWLPNRGKKIEFCFSLFLGSATWLTNYTIYYRNFPDEHQVHKN